MANPATNGKMAQRTGPVRCAIYTRKSTTEGLDSDFSSLDAQREAAEHYIKSQAAEGWVPIDTRYDDGGFTGGNIDRPALTRLLDDIERGEVDMVVVYKVDRLSRSLLDFTRLMARFEAKGVGFVSITQHFDTSTSMGRLVLNILLSFAQFERELISERTRDKVQAARRRGKWTGGHVVLGYDLDPNGGGIVVAPEEAELVRRIFALYLQTFSIGAVAQRLNAEGITRKRRVTRSGRIQGGQEWDKKTVHTTLRNPLYVGQVRVNGGELHPGEHEPIVSGDVFEKVGASLANRSSGQVRRRRTSEYVLAGLLRCRACRAGMTSAFSKGRNGKRYRYYRCVRQQNYGKPCPTGLVPAEKIEQLVVAQIRDVARRGDIQAAVLRRLEEDTGETARVATRRDELNEKLRALTAEAEKVFAAFRGTGAGSKLAAERLRAIEVEVGGLRHDIAGLDDRLTQARAARTRMEEVSRLLDGFDRVWEVLIPEERRELLGLLVAQVTMDAANGDVRITLHDLGPDGAAREEGRA